MGRYSSSDRSQAALQVDARTGACGGGGWRRWLPRSASSLALIAGLLPGFGCGLLDEATTLTLCADPQRFVVDTAQLGFSGAGATLPELRCEAAPGLCAQLAGAFVCSPELWQCSAPCVTRSGGGAVCALRGVLTQGVELDLEAQLRNQLQARALQRLSLARVEYEVSENTLTVATPELRLYVGPAAAKAVGDPGVELLARLAPVAAGATVMPSTVPMEAAGQRRLAELVKDYRTPFRVLIAAEFVLVGGQASPAGRLSLALKPCFKAELI